MQINVIYDPSVSANNFTNYSADGFSSGAAEEAAFKSAINYVVNLYDALFTNNVTFTIDVGWGELGQQTPTNPNGPANGTAIPSNAVAANQASRTTYTYKQIVAALKNDEGGQQSEAAVFNALPGSDPQPSGNFAIPVEQAEMLGLGTFTGSGDNVGFGTAPNGGSWYFGAGTPGPNQTDFIAAAEHEISEGMGRVADVGTGGKETVLDLFRYSSVGARDLNPVQYGTSNTAYFSTDGGVTNGGTFNNDVYRQNTPPTTGENPNYDLADWEPGQGPGPGGNDAYANGNTGVALPLTLSDLAVMNALGWHLSFASNVVPDGVTGWVSSGQTSNGFTVESGGYLEVGSGGAADGAAIANGGTAQVDYGGTASSTVVGAVAVGGGGIETVSGTDVNATIYGVQNVFGSSRDATVGVGGDQEVEPGGKAVDTVLDNILANQLVLSGGDAIGTTVGNGGYQQVDYDGEASNTTVTAGGTETVSGTDVKASIYGVQNVFGAASGSVVLNGGDQEVSGIATNTTISSGGSMQVDYGGFAGETIVNGSATIESGGAANDAVISSGGTETLYAEDTRATVMADGQQDVDHGGEAYGTTVSGGEQVVSSGGEASGTTVDGGREWFGMQEVLSGGQAFNTKVNSGGLLLIAPVGVITDTTVSSGGYLDVEAGFLEVRSGLSDRFARFGGTAIGTSIAAGGTEVVSGMDISATVSGAQTVSAGGTASGTIIDGGTQTVSSQGTAYAAVVNYGGSQVVLSGGTASGTIVKDDGTLDVETGATARGTTVDSGGILELLSDGTASGVTVNRGGTVKVFTGGTLAGNVVNSGTVAFDVTSTAGFSGTLTGSGMLVVSGGGHLDVTSAYTGSAQVDDNSALEFTSACVGVATFSGSPTGPGGTLKFDAGSTGPITVVNPNDTVIAQSGSDSWINALVDYTLPANVDALFLYAGAQGTGNSDATGDALYALDPGITQTLIGNGANDTFVVQNSSDVVVPKASSHDVVYSAVSYTMPTGVDILIMEGSASRGTGNSDAAGDALYAANPGQVATLTGNSANDTFVVYNSSDVVVPKAGSHDLVYSAVNYTLPTGVDSLFLEGAATQAVGNSDVAGDTLNAANAAIAQTLTGHSHNDTFVVYNAADIVIGQAGSTDTLYAAANFLLPTNVDTLYLEANATLGTGNGDAVDKLFGNAGVASTLVAGSGADILSVTGTAGTILTDGAGHDAFAFPNAMGHDEITNFGTAKDVLQFNARLFANFSAAMADATQSGANTVFTIDAHDSVTLDNINKSSLAASNFHFS